jgi:hypothetical protein
MLTGPLPPDTNDAHPTVSTSHGFTDDYRFIAEVVHFDTIA